MMYQGKAKRIISLLMAVVLVMGFAYSGAVPAAAAGELESGANLLVSQEQMEAYKFIDRSLRERGLIGFTDDYTLNGDGMVSVIVEFAYQPPLVQMAEAQITGVRGLTMSGATKSANDAHAQFRNELNALMSGGNDIGIVAASTQTSGYEITSEYYDALNGVALTIPADKVDELATLDSVWAVYPNAIVRVEPVIENYSAYKDAELNSANGSVGMQESRDYMDIAALHDAGITGEGIVVGILDTGVDYNHPSLQDAFATELPKDGSTLQARDGKYYGRNFVQRDTGYFQYVTQQDDNDPMEATYNEYINTDAKNMMLDGLPITWDQYVTAHGTHVAGTLAGREAGDADSSVTGIAPDATLISYRVLGPFGAGYTEWILGGLDYVYEDGCDVVNMSLGATENNPAFVTTLAVNNLIVAHDIVFVIAGGNDGPRTASMGSPGTSSLAITVGNGVLPMVENNLYVTIEMFGSGRNIHMRQLLSDGSTEIGYDEDNWSWTITGGDLVDDPYGWGMPGNYEIIALRNTVGNPDETYTDMNKLDWRTGETYEYDFLLGRGTESDFAALGREVLEGSIVLVGRGLPFVEVAERAKRYGAGMVIVLDYPNGGSQPDSFFVTSPDYAPLFLLRDHWNGTTNTNMYSYGWLQETLENDALRTTYDWVTWDEIPGNIYPIEKEVVCAIISFPKYEKVIAPVTLNSTSSIGPVSATMDIKPDITAPGTSIASSVPYFIMSNNKTNPNAADAYDGALGSMSGTSMASPHIAGLAALMLQYSNKEWSSAEIKARMMNTADPMDGFSVYEVGAGFINVAAAMETETYATVAYNDVYLPSGAGVLSNERGSGDLASLNFRSVMVGTGTEQTVELQATLNNSGGDKTFAVSHMGNYNGFIRSNNANLIADASKWESAGVEIGYPETISVSANAELEFMVSAYAPAMVGNLHTGIYEGYVVLTNVSDPTEEYRLPFSFYLRPESQIGSLFLNHPVITTAGVFYSATNPNTGEYEPGIWTKDDVNDYVHTTGSLYSSLYYELGEPATEMYLAVAPGDIDDITDPEQWLGELPVNLDLSYAVPGQLNRELWLVGSAYFEYESDGDGNIMIDPLKMKVFEPGHYKLVAIVMSPFGVSFDSVDLYVDNTAPEVTAEGLEGNTYTYIGGSRDEVTITGNIYDAGIDALLDLGIDYEIYEPTDPHGPVPDQALNAIFARVAGAPNGIAGEPAYSQAVIQPDGSFTLKLEGLDVDGTTTVELYYLDHFSLEDYEGIMGLTMTYEFNDEQLCMVKTFEYPYAYNGLNMVHKTITVQQVGPSVVLNKQSAVRYHGGYLGLTPTLNEQAIALGYGDSFEWVSSDERVATVDNDGIVTVVDWGTATLTYKTTNADGDVIYASCVLYVPGNHDGVTIDPFANVWMGQYEYPNYSYDEGDVNTQVTKDDEPYGIKIYGEDTWQNIPGFGWIISANFIGEYKKIPMMWDIKGEETHDGVGDRMLTLMSTYATTTMDYNADGVWTPYEQSDLAAYLNGKFITDSFSSAEQNAIPSYTVTNGKYDDDGNLVGEDVLENQRAYIPWGIPGSTGGNFSNYVFWTAGNELNFDQSFKGASVWKNRRRNRDIEIVQWAWSYLRNESTTPGEVLYANADSVVEGTDDWSYFGEPLGWRFYENTGGWSSSQVGYSVSPVIKVDWNSILGHYDVVSDEDERGSNENQLYIKVNDYPSMKLAVQGGNNGADVGTISGLPTDAITATGSSVSFNGIQASKSGTKTVYDELYPDVNGEEEDSKGIKLKDYSYYTAEDYVIAYKVVGGEAGNRGIVRSGEVRATGSAQNLSVSTSGLERGDYVVYVWLMNKCDRESYEVGTVYTIPLYVTGSSSAPTPDIDRQPQDLMVALGSQSDINVIANTPGASGELSYQWYVCDADGSNATPIEGADERVYEFPTDMTGIRYYYVEITCSYSGLNDTAVKSDIAVVTVFASYNVSFDSRGGTAIEPQEVVEGQLVIEPAAPQRDAYVFGGWFTDETCVTAWSFGTDTVTGDTVLFAKWLPILESATPSARVEKLNGNQNRLYITVTEVYSDGSSKTIEWNGLISNNAAGEYKVGEYTVYVDNKGNTQIRECYIVR